MARPRTPEDERRSECFAIRLTPAERLALQDEAERLAMTPTGLARQRLTEGRVVVRPQRIFPPRFGFALGRIGTNLNQIARALNSREDVPPPEIDAAIAELRRLIAAIVAEGEDDDGDDDGASDGP